jgi:ribulose-5-phosphate 4-epimerase/fuculose-1-phosphate aldolase
MIKSEEFIMSLRNTDTSLGNVRSLVTPQEWAVRVDLAACYRLIAHFGWDDLVFTHISARVPGTDHFLINPYGLLFDEVTASNLVKVDLAGNKLLDSPYEINPAGYTIHSAIHQVRHDMECVLHTHTREGVAVSAQRAGLLPISQQATVSLMSLSYHDYEGLALNPAEKKRLQADLGNTVNLILRNHGLLTCGRSIADAFMTMYVLQRACEIQIMAQGHGTELIHVSQSVLNSVPEFAVAVMRNQGSALVWPALLRRMDKIDASYRN